MYFRFAWARPALSASILLSAPLLLPFGADGRASALEAQSRDPDPGVLAPSSPSPDIGPSLCLGRFLPTGALERSSLRTARITDRSPDLGFASRGRAAGAHLCAPAFLETRILAGEQRGRIALTPGRPPGSGSRVLDDRSGSAVRVRGEAPLGTFLPALGSLARHGGLPGVPAPSGTSVRAASILDLLGSLRVGGDARWAPDDVRVDALWVEGTAGPVYGWAGRRAVAYGPGRSGGLTLAGGVPLDGAGIGLEAPRRLPWALAGLGEVDMEAVLARGTRNGDIRRPWILAGRGTLAPGERVVLGLNRGIMFGGEGAADVSLRHMLQVLFGGHSRDEEGEIVPFSNQVASVDVTLHLRPGGVPVAAYLEWGMEDNSGAWARSPGVVAGIEAVHPGPAGPAVRLGLERTYMSGLNGHGLWYRHSVYRAGWSDGGRLLGHPLAGPGTEWLLHGGAADPRGRWDVEAGLRTRERLPGNSFSPLLEGRSWGGFLNARARTGPLDLYVQLDGERTRGGAERLTAEGGVRWVVW